MEIAVPLPESIKTERLLLRRCREEDLEGHTAFLENEKATRFLHLDADQKSAALAAAGLWFIIQSYSSPTPLFFLSVVEQGTEQYVGSTGLAPLADDCGVEFFYNVSPSFWGRGYGAEIGRGVIDYIFTHSAADFVAAFIDLANEPSRRVAAKLGLVEQGLVDHPDYNHPVLKLILDRRNWRH